MQDIDELLPGLGDEEEAIELGVEPLAKQIIAEIERESGTAYDSALRQMHPLQIYLVRFWADSKGISLRAP